MVGISIDSTAHRDKIAKILSGNVEAYVTWADHKIAALERNRQYLLEQRAAAETRCNAAHARLKKVMQSEAEQRVRAKNAEASLAQVQAQLAKATVARRASSASLGLERAIRKLARNPAVAKKLVLVLHPDKCPASLSESAAELFRLVQGIREERKGYSRSE